MQSLQDFTIFRDRRNRRKIEQTPQYWEQRAIFHNHRRFSTGSGRAASCDVITARIQEKPSSFHMRRAWVQLKGLVYCQTSPWPCNCSFSSSSHFEQKKLANFQQQQQKKTQQNQTCFLYGLPKSRTVLAIFLQLPLSIMFFHTFNLTINWP